jgi:phospholipase C
MAVFAGLAHAGQAPSAESAATTTPIKHLIVIVGENHTFDNIFATYRPKNGQSVANLLSRQIVNADGTPSSHFALAQQQTANDDKTYQLAPSQTGPYATLPQPNTTYAYGQTPGVADSRFPADLPNGPFELSKYTAYQGQFTGDPVHRFFQMWQDYDEGKRDLFVWVGQTIGTGSNGNPPPSPFTDQSTQQGAVSMGFNNMAEGDAPALKFIADNYAISDNYHQGIMGGTGANFIYLGTGDVGFYQDGNGNPLTPPSSQIENPDPLSGTNNWYTQDGYSGGSYVDCSDQTQGGVAAITNYLTSLGITPAIPCAPNHYYLVNNYGPAYNADGSLVDTTAHPFTLPPQTNPTIADALSAAGVPWKYYIGGFNHGTPTDAWCSICNPLQFTKSIETTALRNNIQDVSNFYADLASGNLPAVSYIRPYEAYAGHPADSSLSSYEYFVSNVANALIARPKLFKDTAIVMTMDEGGGYYDSGYIQSLDFFGDGTRIPLLVVSPYAKAGYIDHTYYDHGSILKFIEANWGLSPLSARSRDNLPNPVQDQGSYIPNNQPAIGDLMNLFDFSQIRKNTPPIIPGGV